MKDVEAVIIGNKSFELPELKPEPATFEIDQAFLKLVQDTNEYVLSAKAVGEVLIQKLTGRNRSHPRVGVLLHEG